MQWASHPFAGLADILAFDYVGYRMNRESDTIHPYAFFPPEALRLSEAFATSMWTMSKAVIGILFGDTVLANYLSMPHDGQRHHLKLMPLHLFRVLVHAIVEASVIKGELGADSLVFVSYHPEACF
jgi:hypothetical protein